MEPVRCWEEHSKHIETRMGTVLGDMKGGELKTAINDSTIGKLNKYLAVLRTYIEENPLHFQNRTGGSKTTRAFKLHPKWSLVISKGCRMLPYGSISFSYHHTPLLIPMHSLLYHLCESFASSAQCVTVSLCPSDPSRTRRVHK